MSTLPRGIALLACAALPACGDSSVASNPPKDISGNWYFYDSAAPPAAGQLAQIGAALRSVNGRVTGNATVALPGGPGQCGSFGLDLPLTGTVDDRGHVALFATDSVDSLSLNAKLDAERIDGTYRAEGLEAYPLIVPVDASIAAQATCTVDAGTLIGVLMEPVNATYAGALTTSSGAAVQVQLTTHQDTLPVVGGWGNPHTAGPAYILHGQTYFLVGGFFVTGTMQLPSPVCGVTTATIQPKEGYVWGTVLQIEFDSDTTYSQGGTFATFIDPSGHTLNVIGATIYNDKQAPFCQVDLSGTLTRQ